MIDIKSKGLLVSLTRIEGKVAREETLKEIKLSGGYGSLCVLNFADVSHSMRFNPIQLKYIPTLQDALAYSEGLLDLYWKGQNNETSQFSLYKEASANLLAACIYFFMTYKRLPYDADGKPLWPEYYEDPETRHRKLTGRVFDTEGNRDIAELALSHKEIITTGQVTPAYWLGKYSDMPHVLSFLNHDYSDIFEVLVTNPEVFPLLAPFRTAYDNKAMEQLEGMMLPVRVMLAKIVNKANYWILHRDGDDFSLNENKGFSHVMTICRNGSPSDARILSYLITKTIQDRHPQDDVDPIMEDILNIEPYKFDSQDSKDRILEQVYNSVEVDIQNLIMELQHEFTL